MNRRALLEAFLAGGAAAAAAIVFPSMRGEVLRSLAPHRERGYRLVWRGKEWLQDRLTWRVGAVVVVDDPPAGYPEVLVAEIEVPGSIVSELKAGYGKTDDEVVSGLLDDRVEVDMLEYRRDPASFYPEVGQLEA